MATSRISTPAIQITKPEVFIIESLTMEDEEKGYFEGRVLSDILKMCGKKPIYYYCRTESELQMLVLMFRESGYRYLHLSCHGSATSIETTLDSITYINFAKMLEGLMKNRRLFVSACETGNELFSTVVSARNKGMYSIAAPSEQIRFDHAVALWSAFYVKAFSIDNTAMKRKHIDSALRKLCQLFLIDFHWSYYRAEQDKWDHKIIQKT